MTDAMKDITVRIMVEVLEIFGIMTKEIKQGHLSESIPDYMSPVADRDSEKSLKELIGRKGIKDALSRLDRLTQEAVKMGTVILGIVHHIRDGTSSTLAPQKDHLNPTND